MKVKRLTACMLAGAMALSIALTGCGKIDANAVGATLDGKEISLGFMNFMARYQQMNYDASMAYYAAYYGSEYGIEYWSQTASEEEKDDDGNVTKPAQTMEESVKEAVAENIELLYLLEAHMADYNVKITDEETTAIEEAAKKFIQEDDKDKLTFLVDLGVLDSDETDQAIDLALSLDKTEFTAFLMDYKHRNFSMADESFDL